MSERTKRTNYEGTLYNEYRYSNVPIVNAFFKRLNRIYIFTKKFLNQI